MAQFTDQQIRDFFNTSSAQEVSDAALQYNVSLADIARATGNSAGQINSWLTESGAGALPQPNSAIDMGRQSVINSGINPQQSVTAGVMSPSDVVPSMAINTSPQSLPGASPTAPTGPVIPPNAGSQQIKAFVLAHIDDPATLIRTATAEGITDNQIADALGKSYGQVQQWFGKLKAEDSTASAQRPTYDAETGQQNNLDPNSVAALIDARRASAPLTIDWTNPAAVGDLMSRFNIPDAQRGTWLQAHGVNIGDAAFMQNVFQGWSGNEARITADATKERQSTQAAYRTFGALAVGAGTGLIGNPTDLSAGVDLATGETLGANGTWGLDAATLPPTTLADAATYDVTPGEGPTGNPDLGIPDVQQPPMDLAPPGTPPPYVPPPGSLNDVMTNPAGLPDTLPGPYVPPPGSLNETMVTPKGLPDVLPPPEMPSWWPGTAAEWAKLAAAFAPAAIGAWSAKDQAQSLADLARAQREAEQGRFDTLLGVHNREYADAAAQRTAFQAVGAPSRARYESSFAPGFTMASDPGYRDMLDQGTQSILRSVSPGGIQPSDLTYATNWTSQNLAYPALQSYRGTNERTGGYASANAAGYSIPGNTVVPSGTTAPATVGAGSDLASINSGANVLNAFGGALADYLNPRTPAPRQPTWNNTTQRWEVV